MSHLKWFNGMGKTQVDDTQVGNSRGMGNEQIPQYNPIGAVQQF
jgi:hypothetical protein